LIYILLPAYNEGENIRPLLETIVIEARAYFGGKIPAPFPIHAVVVDDGSVDDTARRARDFSGPIQVTLLQHERNQGLAAALRTGLDFILARGGAEDWIVTLDADRTHHPRYIFALIDKLKTGFDVVVASRYAPGGREFGVSLWRRMLSHGARRIYHLFFSRIPLRDFSCGFRGFSYAALRSVSDRWGDRLLESEGFSCTGELMLKTLAHVQPNRVAEISFELHYEQKAGVSKMPALKTIWGTLKLIWKARGWLRG
jgi:dolichol-phosphate mannosyltransferase